jgi:signal transduction histidine kinase/ligand-binding sensor domain-containing protein
MPKILYICLISGFAGLALSIVQSNGSDFDLTEPAESMRTWHSKDGLPSDSVTAVIQTSDDFLWVGTTAGLVRFDGAKFTDVKLPASSTNNYSTYVTALCQDSNGFLWVGTQRQGLFELEHGKIRHFTEKQGLLDDGVTSLAADSHGSVWIGGKSGLNLWTGKKFKSFTTKDGLSDDFVSGVNVARSGTVWITTRVGMCRYIKGHIAPYVFQTESQGRSPEYLGAYEDRRGNLWAFGDTYLINLAEGKRFNYFRSSESASVRIWSLCEGRDGRLWIGTSGRGLFCFENGRFQPVLLGQERWPYDVRSICEDNEGNLWLGTSGGGLVQLHPQSVHVLRAGQGLPTGYPTALATDVNGQIYVGLQRGGLFVGESGRFDRVGGNEGLEVQDFISSVSVTRGGTVWAGTLGDGVYGLRNGRRIHLTTADGLADNTVLAVCADNENHIWISTSAGTVHCFDGKQLTQFGMAQGLPDTPVTTIIRSVTDGLWLGTQKGQILHEADGKFTVVNPSEKIAHPVLALYQNEPGRLWIGTDGGGLECLMNGVETSWGVSNGLPSDIVAGMTEDDSKNLWLATGEGIYRISHGSLRRSLEDHDVPLVCKLISDARTAPSSPTIFGGRRAVLSSGGQLWFATSEGILNVSTDQSKPSPTPAPIYIESVAFNGQPPISLLRGQLWATAKSTNNNVLLEAPADLRSLEIHFTALNFTSPREIRFRHKLDGFDSDWVDDGNTRLAHYGHLPYGHYRFHVAVSDADGRWEESPESFSFVVPTPLYFQTWAISLYILIVVAIVVGVVRVVSHRRLRFALTRLEQQQTLERERMRIARDMHDEMGSKLTKISFLSEHAQVDADSAGPLAGKIEAIAETSRELLKTMDEIVWVVNPRNDTLENLTAYLSHYAVEYFQNTSVECELRLSQEIPHYPLSSEARHNLFLTFEEALNNVLKHSAAQNVKVEITVHGRDFEIRVSDNGRGFDASELLAANIQTRGGRGGNGLKNMRQRLAAIGGECLISSSPGKGASVTMRIRLTKTG